MLVAGAVGKDDVAAIELDDLAVVEEQSAVSEAARLLGEVGDQDDGHMVAKFLEDVLDAHGGDGIDGDGELVEAEDFGFVGEGAGDGEPLLLSAGEFSAEGVEAILDLIPKGGLAEAFFHDGVEVVFAAHAGAARGEGDIVVDGERQADGEGGHHADFAAEGIDVAVAADVFAIDLDGAGEMGVGGEIDGAVDAAEEGGFAGLGGADDAEDLVGVDVEGEAVEDLFDAERQAEVADGNMDRWAYHFLRERR